MNILPALSILLFSFYLHPLHISITEIEMDEKDKALEITMRLFIDDMELALRKDLNQPDLDILKLKTSDTNEYLQNYLKDRFTISLDNKLQKTKYLGHEVEDDAFVVYIEVINVKHWKAIQIKNSVLTDVYDDQSNLVHVTVKSKVHSLRLTPENPIDKLNFDLK